MIYFVKLINSTSGETVKGTLDTDTQLLKLSEMVHGKTDHQFTIGDSCIGSWANLIAAYLSSDKNKKLYTEEYDRFTKVSIFNDDFVICDEAPIKIKIKESVVDKTVFALNNAKFDDHRVILTDTSGKQHVVMLSDLLLDIETYKECDCPVGLKYTKNEEVNNILRLCKQPKDYDKTLSKFIVDNLSWIRNDMKKGTLFIVYRFGKWALLRNTEKPSGVYKKFYKLS